MTDTPAQPVPAPALSGPQTTRLNRTWVIKTCIYLVVLLGLGIWGLVDGLIVYPERGRNAASFLEKEYLVQAEKAGELFRASIADPRAEFERLRAVEDDLRMRGAQAKAEQRSADQVEMELARLEWLTALSRIGELDPANTALPDPSARLTTLQNEWTTRKPPKPLSAFDIPSQWLIAVAGLGLGGWIVFLFAAVARKKYRYDPAEMRLTLPCGRTLVPADIAELDKRQWHKFFVTVRAKDGGSYKLDLLRYAPLEQWILEMEKHTDGYEPPVETPAEEPAAAT
ncbi:MAG: hypothetical protein IBJ10_00755 [Phycisphaerales bacterium]|nr:hypothetical protein [Phycisphaerales bacterium]